MVLHIRLVYPVFSITIKDIHFAMMTSFLLSLFLISSFYSNFFSECMNERNQNIYIFTIGMVWMFVCMRVGVCLCGYVDLEFIQFK